MIRGLIENLGKQTYTYKATQILLKNINNYYDQQSNIKGIGNSIFQKLHNKKRSALVGNQTQGL